MLDDDETFDDSPTLFRKANKARKTPISRKAARDVHEELSDAPISSGLQRPKKPFITNRLAVNSQRARSTNDARSVYSNDYLSELRQSTPSTPKEFATIKADVTDQDDAEELAVVSEARSIPEEGLVRHVKEQRQLHRDTPHDYIALSEVNSQESGSKGRRLQTEDDVDNLGGDGTDGLQGYESDSLPVGEQSLKKALNTKKLQMQEEIEEFEVEAQKDSVLDLSTGSSSDSDDEWEQTQVRKSMGINAGESLLGDNVSAQRLPENMSLQTLEQVMARLQRSIDQASAVVSEKEANLAAITQAELAIANQENLIKRSLENIGLAYETNQIKITAADLNEIRGR